METIDTHEGDNGIAFFSLKIDGQEVGRMMVTINSGILRAWHTGVDISQRKNGFGRKLVYAMVDYPRAHNLKVIADCGFVAMLFNQSPKRYENIRGRDS